MLHDTRQNAANLVIVCNTDVHSLSRSFQAVKYVQLIIRQLIYNQTLIYKHNCVITNLSNASVQVTHNSKEITFIFFQTPASWLVTDKSYDYPSWASTEEPR